MSKIKIVFLIPTLMHGGAEKVLVNLVNYIDKSRFDVTLYSIFDVGVNKDFLYNDVNYQYKFKKMFRGYARLANLFSPQFLYTFFIKEKYDIIVSYLEGPATRIVSGCSNPDTKKIAWVHIQLDDEKKAKIGFRNIQEAQRYYSAFDEVVGVSKKVIELFNNNINVGVSSRVLYNTNDTGLIKKMAKEEAEIQFDRSAINVCSVGKVLNTKGFGRLMAVHKRLLNEGFPHHIHILGIGEDLEQLQERAKDLGVQDSFHFLGFQKNPYQYVVQCDLYVCSSFREGFSTAVSEALILGIPIVSTNCSGAEEMLGDQNEYGIVVENSTEGIYGGMKKMLSESQTLAYYKNRAEIRGGFFSTENTVKAVEELLESLVEK